MRAFIFLLPLAIGCADQTPTLGDVDQGVEVCGTGSTVKGIDVSVYQGTIDWSKVKADGVQFAVIRVSDGTANPDSKFDANWAGAKAQGLIRGAYQFFRPGGNVIAQADMLLAKIGSEVKPGELPPVLDVEAADGLPPATVAAKVKQWLDYVAGKIGRRPIVYTGFYFWRDSVGGPDDTSSPLWHAQYTTAQCPNIAAPWTDWAMWQYSSSGTVSGISGNVDMNRWNGNRASLDAFVGPAQPCGTITAAGGVIDDGDACFDAGGPQAYMRHVTTAGEDGDLYWTHATADATEANFGQWNLDFDEAGHYKVEVYTAAAFAQSKRASYVVHAASGDQHVLIDQSATDGWQTLGSYDFAKGDQQWIHLGDNTGEPVGDNVQLVFDAVRLTRDDGSNPDGSGSGSGDMDPGHAGCNAGGGASDVPLLGIVLGLGLRRRRRPSV